MLNFITSYEDNLPYISGEFLTELTDILLFSTWSPIFSVSSVTVMLLMLGVFLTHTGELTRFLHKIGFAYLIFALFIGIGGFNGNVIRFTDLAQPFLLEMSQEDSMLFRLFAVYGTIIVAIFFYGVSERFFLSKSGASEFPLLVLSLHIGGLFVLRLHTFSDLLLALESITLGSYVLATFERQNRFSTYAGVQYFIMGSLPSASLMLGFGLFYLQGGSFVMQDLDMLFNSFSSGFTHFGENIASAFFMDETNIGFSGGLNSDLVVSNWYFNPAIKFETSSGFFGVDESESVLTSMHPMTAMTTSGLLFVFLNLLFKLTAAPFHVWAPSVYGKAPMASVTFLSIYSKASALFFLFKLLTTFLHAFSSMTFSLLLFCGVLSVFIGSVGAFTEKTIKRFFVFSSSGHVGFSLAGLSLSTVEGSSSSFHYLLVYIFSSFMSWFLLLTSSRDKHHLMHFVTLKGQEPLLALIFALLMFSSSGIPPLGGFFMKLDVLAALLDNSHFMMNYMLFFFTVASFFYYLRVIKMIFFDEKEITHPAFSYSKAFSVQNEMPRHVGRLWISVFLFLMLGFYLFIVQKPLLAAQSDAIAALS